MKLTKERKILLEALITLQLINYMVGTIILKDFFLVKYLRDAIVVVLLFEIARDRRKKTAVWNNYDMFLGVCIL